MPPAEQLGTKRRANAQGDQYAPELEPGVRISQDHRSGPAEVEKCTLGPAITGTDNRRGFLTAGHCDVNRGAPVYAYPHFQADIDHRVRISGGYTSATTEMDPSEFRIDAAELWPDADAGVGAVETITRVAGEYPVVGVLTVEEVKQLKRGTPVCFDGTVSGLQCGPLKNPDRAGILHFAAPGEIGDSGGPVFLLDKSNHAVVIGIQQGGPHHEWNAPGQVSDIYATYLEPTLQELGVRALLSPEVAPYVGPQFSREVERP